MRNGRQRQTAAQPKDRKNFRPRSFLPRRSLQWSDPQTDRNRRDGTISLFYSLFCSCQPVLRLPSSADIRLPGQCASRAIPTVTLKPSRPNGIFLRYEGGEACPGIGALYRRPPPPSTRRDPIAFCDRSLAHPLPRPMKLSAASSYTHGRLRRTNRSRPPSRRRRTPRPESLTARCELRPPTRPA